MASIHDTRIGPYALFDIVGTVAGAYAITAHFDVPLWKTLLFSFAAGVVAHVVFDVPTALNRQLGLA